VAIRGEGTGNDYLPPEAPELPVQGKTTVAEASRQFDLQPSEIEEWIDQGKAGMETPCEPSRKMSASSTSDS
jgi:transposase-like protein